MRVVQKRTFRVVGLTLMLVECGGRVIAHRNGSSAIGWLYRSIVLINALGW